MVGEQGLARVISVALFGYANLTQNLEFQARSAEEIVPGGGCPH